MFELCYIELVSSIIFYKFMNNMFQKKIMNNKSNLLSSLSSKVHKIDKRTRA